jgi:hypothetical protein
MQWACRGDPEVVVMPVGFNIIERAIWMRTWLALRMFRTDGRGGDHA